MAGVVRILMPERGCRHQIHAVGHSVGKDRRVPGVAGGKEAGEVVVVGQVGAVVVAHGTGAVGIVFLGNVVGGVEKIVHSEGEGGGCGPGCVAALQGGVVMAFVPRGSEILDALGGLMERRDSRASIGVGEGNAGSEYVDRGTVVDAGSREAQCAIAGELSEVHVERAILLQHEEDVLDHAEGCGSDREAGGAGEGTAVGRGGGSGVGGGDVGLHGGGA